MGDDWVGPAVAAARRGDEAAFGRLVERFRPELTLHCYRMLGSLDDAEDTVQDVFLAAWRGLAGFEGRSSARTWLYRIATHACLARRARDHRRYRLLSSGTTAGAALPVVMTVPWLQACPDDLIDRAEASDPDPASTLVARETIELAVIAALQHLPGRQRAVFLLRDVVGWPAHQCAAELGLTVPAVNSAAQRARAGLRRRLGGRDQWPAHPATTPAKRALVRRYIDAIETADDAAIAALLHDDVVVTHQPGAGGNQAAQPLCYTGKTAVLAAWAPALHSPQPLHMRLLEAWANRQPGVASYVRLPGTAEHRAFGLSLLRVHNDQITEITNLTAGQAGAFGLPATFFDPQREQA
jgi:RNA polymerase sigma-70 factor (ECF subfamily)